MADEMTVDEILDFAIEREQEAVDFYSDLAEKVKTAAMKDVFQQFAKEVDEFKPKSQTDITALFESTRPSAYHSWIRKQPDRNRLLMYILWAVRKTNQFAREQDMRHVFDTATSARRRK